MRGIDMEGDGIMGRGEGDKGNSNIDTTSQTIVPSPAISISSSQHKFSSVEPTSDYVSSHRSPRTSSISLLSASHASKTTKSSKSKSITAVVANTMDGALTRLADVFQQSMIAPQDAAASRHAKALELLQQL